MAEKLTTQSKAREGVQGQKQHLAVTGVSSGRKQVHLADDLGMADQDNALFFADRDPHGLRLRIRKGDPGTQFGDREKLCVHGRRAGIRHQVQGGDEPVKVLQPALHGQGTALPKRVVLAGIGSRMQPELRIAARIAVIPLAGLYQNRKPEPLRSTVFCPPPHTLCADHGRTCQRNRQLSASRCRCLLDDLRGERVAGARTQPLCPRYPAALLAGERGVREYRFGKRVGSIPLMTLAAKDWSEAVKNADPDWLHHPDISEGINLYYHLQTALYEDEVLAYARTAQPQAAQSVWYPSVGILVSRSRAWVAGVKAGCNNDSHNHNDVGSVTLYRDGRPLLVDIGVETYSKKTFSAQRYEIWTMQSSWHNLPEFDPNGKRWQQLPGSQYRAAEVQVGSDLHTISMNIAPAYGQVPGLTYYRRTVQLTENRLQMQDVTDYPGEIALILMSEEKPEVNGAVVRFGTQAQMTVEGAGRITTEEIPIHDDRLHLAWQNSLYRTRIWFKTQIDLCIGDGN